MGVVPDNRVGKLEFYEAHLAPVDHQRGGHRPHDRERHGPGHPHQHGAQAYSDHLAAQAAAKAATANFYDKVRLMHSGPGAGADMIQTIKTFAQTSNNPNVYVLAQVPPPAAPGTTPPPGTPFDFTVSLLQDGSLDLRWKCSNPAGTVGTIYEVMRQIGAGAMSFVGASGVKEFTDDTIPAGSSPCTYQVTAVRSTSRGNPAQFTVNFGVSGPGLTISSITGENTSVQMAA